MDGTIVLNPSEFEMPEEAKISRVFDRLMKVNAAVTQNGIREVYYEKHDRYEEAYGISFF